MAGTVMISIDLPAVEGYTKTDYVLAALKAIARSFFSSGRDIEQAAIKGNWNFNVDLDPSLGYQPTLWEVK